MTRTAPRTRPRPWIAALAAGVLSVGTVAGSAAYGAWSASATATGSVSAAQVSVTVTGDMDAVLRYSETVVTRAVTVTNTTAGTSTDPVPVTVRIKGSGDFGIAQALLLRVWPTSDAATCTESAPNGPGGLSTWSAGATLTAQLAPGRSQSYCVRTLGVSGSVPSLTGTRALVATTTASLALGTYRASAQHTATIATKAMYLSGIPGNGWYQVKVAGTQECLDVAGGTAAVPGAVVGTYACHASTLAKYGNQWISPKERDSRVDLRVKLPAGTSLQADGSAVTAPPTNTNATGQRWMVQSVSATLSQIVSFDTGLCLTAPPGTGVVTMAVCDDLPGQHFAFVPLAVPGPAAGDLDAAEGVPEPPAADGETAGSPSDGGATEEETHGGVVPDGLTPPVAESEEPAEPQEAP